MATKLYHDENWEPTVNQKDGRGMSGDKRREVCMLARRTSCLAMIRMGAEGHISVTSTLELQMLGGWEQRQ